MHDNTFRSDRADDYYEDTNPVLDDGKKRVQILDGETAATIAGGNGEGPAANQFSGSFGGMALAPYT